MAGVGHLARFFSTSFLYSCSNSDMGQWVTAQVPSQINTLNSLKQAVPGGSWDRPRKGRERDGLPRTCDPAVTQPALVTHPWNLLMVDRMKWRGKAILTVPSGQTNLYIAG